MKLNELSKEISYALRHAPHEYELELDEEGFVLIDQLLHAINEGGNYDRTVTKADLEEIIRTSEKKRHEIVGDKIRALYGHSVPQFIKKAEGVPPKVLYHGTTKEALGSIKKNGLVPMQRQYVHLSVDREMADSVARRKKKDIAILQVDTEAAQKNGIKFYVGNDKVWLADNIPSKYIGVGFFGPTPTDCHIIQLDDYPTSAYAGVWTVEEFIKKFPDKYKKV